MSLKRRKLIGRLIYICCLFVWVCILAGVMYYYLQKLNKWLIEYQAAYDNTRPVLTMDEYYKWFSERDAETIFANLDERPFHNEYETEENAKLYMTSILNNHELSFSPSEDYSEALPEYNIVSDKQYIVSTLRLHKSTTMKAEHGFPVWELDRLSFRFLPQYSVKIVLPSNVSATINGIPLDEKYCYSTGEPPKDQDAFGDYATLPYIKRYIIDDFYQLPVVEAVNSDGYAAAITSPEIGLYEASLGEFPNEEEMKQVAIDTAITFANYLAKDVDKAVMLSYFVPECAIIKEIIRGRADAGEFFKAHSRIEYTNISIEDFTCYGKEVFCCSIYMDQEVYRYSTEPFDTDRLGYRLYFIKIDGEWIACNLEFC